MATPSSGYKQLRYIDSSGKQYLDTGFKPNNNTRVLIEAEYLSTSGTNPALFGARTSATSKNYAILYVSNALRSDYNNVYTNTWSMTPLKKYTYDKNKETTTINGETKSYTNNTFQCDYNLFLFALNQGGTAQWNSTVRMYSCKIYDNGTLVRDFVPYEDNNGVAGMWDNVGNTFYKSKTSTNFISGLYSSISSGMILKYAYTGNVQSVTLPKGIYKLETWGAQGGTYSSYYGGLGGYSVGTLTIENDTTLFIHVGGQPASNSSNRVQTNGGYNGGGKGYNRYYSSTYTYGQGGGGGTDIRIGQDSLYARVIVAGGGGGSASQDDKATKYGGGTTGGSPQSGYAGTATTGGSNGNKGSFGQGGNVTTSGNNYKYGSGGGGGGWYGGAAGSDYSDSSSSTYRGKNGGGSGYVYTSSTASQYPSGCLLNSTYYLTDAKTQAGNTSFPNTSTGIETGHSGNGYVRITVIKAGSVNLPVKIGGTWKETDSAFVKIGGAWKEIDSIHVKVGGTWKELG